MSEQELLQQIKEQGVVVKDFRSGGKATELAEANNRMKELKDQLSKLKMAAAAAAKTGKESNGANKEVEDASKKSTALVIKTPKGTIDYSPSEMAMRAHVFSTITDIYRRHGAVTIDTPVFELRDILQGKYGEDTKLIYDLQDQGGERCSLRYDLTVPFARYLALNTDGRSGMKRFHIGKVYRRDQPAMTKGRMREFYQCDYDIAGTYERMIPDAEVISVMCETLSALEIGTFEVKINHRCVLDGVFAVCGVPQNNFRAICSAVDKSDKLSWAEVRKEMVDEKGLDPAAADKIGTFICKRGGVQLVEELLKHPLLGADARARSGLEDMKLLFSYLEIFGVGQDKVKFDLSLARGLDYYTGVIYEAVLTSSGDKSRKGKKDDDDSVGSVAAGGRYDELAGMFSPKGNKIPCVGMSIGVERIFAILKRKLSAHGGAGMPRQITTDVYVCGIDSQLPARMAICKELWQAGISADFSYKAKVKLARQFEYCEKKEHSIPWVVIVGDDELARGEVRIKDMRKESLESASAEDKAGVVVKKADMVGELKRRLAVS